MYYLISNFIMKMTNKESIEKFIVKYQEQNMEK